MLVGVEEGDGEDVCELVGEVGEFLLCEVEVVGPSFGVVWRCEEDAFEGGEFCGEDIIGSVVAGLLCVHGSNCN